MPSARIARLLCRILLNAAVGAHLAFAPSLGAQTSRAVLPPIDSASLASFADSFFAADLAELQVPGAVISVVQHGRVIFAKGYGVADLATHATIDPATTVFRVGSVSKPVAATAIMQLVEQGKVRLDDDILRYLPELRASLGGGQPITVSELLTHTAGFDVRLIGSGAASVKDVTPLAEYVRQAMPPRVREPGRVLAYSNYGYTLLGRIVEKVSAEPFEHYMRAHIFQPLGMTHSGYAFTHDVAAAAATGYEPRRPAYTIARVIHPNILPAGSLNSTALDMAKFMIAQLDSGVAGGARILRPSTLLEMHRQHFAPDARVAGMTYGLFESFENGQRTLLHVGGIRGFISGLYLWPEHHVGMFVSDNGYHTDLVRDAAIAFVDHFFPWTPPRLLPRAGAREHSASLAGVYRMAAHARRNMEKAGALRGSDELPVEDGGDGTLRAFGDRFVEVEPGLYRSEKGDETLAFPVDRSGAAPRLVTTDLFAAVQEWERLPWYETGDWNDRFLAVAIAAFLSIIVWPPRVTGRAKLFDKAPAEARIAVNARRALLSTVALYLIGLLTLVIAMRSVAATGLLLGVPLLARIALMLGALGALSALTLPYFGARIWHARCWALPTRVHFTAVAAIAVLFIAFLAYWRLLGVPG